MYCSFTNYFQQNCRLNLLSSLENRASTIIDTKGRAHVPSINPFHKRKICKFVQKCLDEAANFVNYFTLIDHGEEQEIINARSDFHQWSLNLTETLSSSLVLMFTTNFWRSFIQKPILTILLIYWINMNLYSFLLMSLHLLGKSFFHCHLFTSASVQVITTLQWQKLCITWYMQFLNSFNHTQLFYWYLQSFNLNFRIYSNFRLILLRRIRPNLT